MKRDEILRAGGWPQASFVIAFKPGFEVGDGLKGDVVVPSLEQGNHGYLPDTSGLNAAFFAMGTGIAAHRNLGVIDMRQIAPTVAEMLGIKLPAGTLLPLNYKR